jgi:phosphoenolpyruvate synthase/pyruvate phosphate dikinase
VGDDGLEPARNAFGPGDAAERFVAGIGTFGRDDPAVAGGKGANLGELVRGGFAVPDGFVVSTAAYAAAVVAGGLDVVIAEGLEAGDDAAIRAAFENIAVPDGPAAAITTAYADLGAGPVAVRSSATAEDLPGASFAGQHDTYLDVVGADAVLDAVRRCWGSLWTARAIAYRARRDSAPAALRIAVVVQRMVDAEYAGVMFTAHPVTGERSEVVIDAGAGPGEAVVSGPATPDHYVLDADGTVVEWTSGRREVVIRAAAAAGRGGTRDVDVTDRTPLPASVLAELAASGRAIAAHFGGPQDVEWAYASGRVWFVQARPMTALPPPPLRLDRLRRAADVVHLRLAEIEAVADPDRLPRADAVRLRDAVRRRAARRAEPAGAPMIAAASLRSPADAGDALVSGVPASGGRATGPVRVVRSPAEFATMRRGDVLVCPYTDPSWTPLFQRAAAVVVDSGGLGSHAAIVAREYGIPAVMGTGSGTTTLVDGRYVTVDGTTGRVTAADPS